MYKSNYPTIIPQFVVKPILKIFLYIFYPVAITNTVIHYFTSLVFTNMFILSIIGLTINYFLPIYNYSATYILLFILAHFLTHLQIAPMNTLYTNKYAPKIGYPFKYVFLLIIFVISTILATYYSILFYFISSSIGFILSYWYHSLVFKKDRKNLKSNNYKFEFIAPLTSGMYYAYVLSLFIAIHLSLYIAMLFSINSILFYTFRIYRNKGKRNKYRLRELYVFTGLSIKNINSNIRKLREEKKLDKTSKSLYDYEKLNKLMSGEIEWSEFEKEITKVQDSDEIIQIKNDIREDIKWSWMELKEELDKYTTVTDDLDFDSFELEDIQTLQQKMIKIQEDNNFPIIVDNTLDRFITKLENSEKYWITCIESK